MLSCSCLPLRNLCSFWRRSHPDWAWELAQRLTGYRGPELPFWERRSLGSAVVTRRITSTCEIWGQSTKDIGGELYSLVCSPMYYLTPVLLLPRFCKDMTWDSWLPRKLFSGSCRLWLFLSTKDTAEALSCSVSKLNVVLSVPLSYHCREVIACGNSCAPGRDSAWRATEPVLGKMDYFAGWGSS